MGYESIEVAPITPRIGANVASVTLAKPLSNRLVEELHQALAEHQVLFFRDQPLDVEAHKGFGRYFGELHIHPSTPGPDGHPEILPIHADANSRRINGEYWHSDVSCDEAPPAASILYLHTVPPVGGDTLFASQYAAYDALSPQMKTYLEGMTATHSGDHIYRRNNALIGLPDLGGDTLFASQYAAYDALSPQMKTYLEGMTATHSGDHIYRRNNALIGLP